MPGKTAAAAETLPMDVSEHFHALEALAADVHRTYFWKYAPLTVRWGQQIGRKKRRSIRLGSYNHQTEEIRIHPLLNSSRVPTWFIQSVIHHEYLHHVLGASHNRRFHAHERQFHYYRESQEWIRSNLFFLLGRKKSELQQAEKVAAKPEPAMTQISLFLR